jgi:hypothetical protein
MLLQVALAADGEDEFLARLLSADGQNQPGRVE